MLETMSLTRILREVKSLDKRITKKINETQFIDYYQPKNEEIGGMITHLSTDNFDKDVKAKYKSITDLMDNRNKLKAALAQANAITKVKVKIDDEEQEFSIASAIELKRSISFKKSLLATLKQQYANIKNNIDDNDVRLHPQLNDLFKKLVGDKSLESPEFKEHIMPFFVGKNQFKMLDPLKIKDKIEKLDKDIDDFESNIDIALSEINGITTVEIDLAKE
jgi:copper chaperone CopZ